GEHFSRTLDELIERRVQFLTDYQDARYAERYRALVQRVRKRESEVTASSKLTEAVARYYAKLLAYKDEYEVARLHTSGALEQKVGGMFEGDYKLVFHLAPPLVNKPDPDTGEPRKSSYGPWMMGAFRVLAKMRRLRGTALDIFGRTAERRMERQLIADYETLIEELLASLGAHNHAIAVEIASIPEQIRGYGHVKDRHLRAAKEKEAKLVAAFRAATATAPSAERVAA
ncbi:MAG TPA: DUF6537 domain-containing protein, partial [Casimicrobiaceae bacterium]|nr:DUF6537 domain-containing protein [Casimicrobiaceae bacterium]